MSMSTKRLHVRFMLPFNEKIIVIWFCAEKYDNEMTTKIDSLKAAYLIYSTSLLVTFVFFNGKFFSTLEKENKIKPKAA